MEGSSTSHVLGRLPSMFNNAAVLFQGESYAEFKDTWDDCLEHPPPMSEAIRLINTQTEIIEEALNRQLSTILQRRQAISYLLEQCVLLSAALPADRMKDRRRMRVLRRMAERMRRIVRGDRL